MASRRPALGAAVGVERDDNRHGESLQRGVTLRAGALHVEGVPGADSAAARNVAQDGADAPCGSHRDRLTSIQPAVVPVELGQGKNLACVVFGGLL